MKPFLFSLEMAHEDATNAYNTLTDISEQVRTSDVVFYDEDFKDKIEELTALADELQGELLELLEKIKNGKS